MGRGKNRGRGRNRNPRDKRRAPRRRSQTVEATVRVIRPGFAYAHTQEGTFAFTRGGLREAMDGDRVLVSVVHPKNSEPRAITQHVVERAVHSFVGIFDVAGPLGVVVPLDERVRRDFFVVPEDSSPARLGVKPGNVVRARVTSYPTRAEAGVVTLDENLGSQDGLDIDMEALIASFGLAQAFPPQVLDEASHFELDSAAELARNPHRRDLRDLCCVTIDPADARDYDDAISCTRLANGGFELGVHIADVSHYVRPESACDLEARARTCSVYLADRVLPMLPEALSEELCSLKPAQDRLTMSVLIRLSAHGAPLSWEVTPAVIRSRARLSYDAVDAYLATGERSELELRSDAQSMPAGAVPTQPQDLPAIAQLIDTAHELEQLRARLRAARGAIDFDTEEVRVSLDDKGVPKGVIIRRKTAATSLVEEAMLVANECVAAQLAAAQVETAYRVHEAPVAEKLADAVAILRELGVAKGELAARVAAADPFAIQEVLAQVKGTTAQPLVDAVLLRAQARALYRPENLGHFALAAPAYCHFTSPIRRYPDVLVHRSLKQLMYQGKAAGSSRPHAHTADKNTALAGRVAAGGLAAILGHCSEQERVADSAARASQNIKMAQLYEGRIGQVERGMVRSVASFGMFVVLDDTLAEVLVSVRTLGQGWVNFDEKHLQLTDSATGTTWRPGSRVEVRIVDTDRARGRISGELAREERLRMSENSLVDELTRAEGLMVDGQDTAARELLSRLAADAEEYVNSNCPTTDEVQWFSFPTLVERLIYRRTEEDPRELRDVGEPLDRLYSDLALVNVRQGNYEEATAALRQAVRWNPVDCAHRLNLADLYLTNGNGNEFLALTYSCFERASDALHLIRAYLNFARYYGQTGKPELQAACLRCAMQLDMPDVTLEQALERVAGTAADPANMDYERAAELVEAEGIPQGANAEVAVCLLMVAGDAAAAGDNNLATRLTIRARDLVGEPAARALLELIHQTEADEDISDSASAPTQKD